ncbi:hypothetical protein [Ancylobacter sp. SL191]|uniref:hypothetical protein n=1 Tax=Ancylobacter sp. SL191 TaxID=2995166 RepID=UPI00226EC2E0|nr:hypothetical protein [Ancylobacter sp. SL191]WAC27914.1 hypothetical protein OU996_02215 [Ancylobacter sp. SL191]
MTTMTAITTTITLPSRLRAASAGLLALTLLGGATGALAGPCAERIATLDKQLATTDAGSGPTNSPAAPTTAPDAGVPKAGEAPGTGGTAGMNEALGTRAASPADVRAQTAGSGTAAQGQSSTAGALSDAMSRAKQADQSGDSAACTKALDEAEAMLRG